MPGVGKHVRRQVIDDVVARMLQLDPAIGVNVYEDPADAIPDENLPFVLVELSGEDIENMAITHSNPNDYRQIRSISIEVSVVAITAAQRDELSARIEEDIIVFSKIGRSREIQGVALDNNSEGAKRFWTATHTFLFKVHTQSLDPYQIIRTG